MDKPNRPPECIRAEGSHLTQEIERLDDEIEALCRERLAMKARRAALMRDYREAFAAEREVE